MSLSAPAVNYLEVAVDNVPPCEIEPTPFPFWGRRAGLVIQELGVDWYYREHSKVRPIRDSIATTWDSLRMRWRYRAGRNDADALNQTSDRADQ